MADLRAFEDRVNPDGVNTYGFTDLPESCASQFDPDGPFADQAFDTAGHRAVGRAGDVEGAHDDPGWVGVQPEAVVEQIHREMKTLVTV